MKEGEAIRLSVVELKIRMRRKKENKSEKSKIATYTYKKKKLNYRKILNEENISAVSEVEAITLNAVDIKRTKKKRRRISLERNYK